MQTLERIFSNEKPEDKNHNLKVFFFGQTDRTKNFFFGECFESNTFRNENFVWNRSNRTVLIEHVLKDSKQLVCQYLECCFEIPQNLN